MGQTCASPPTARDEYLCFPKQTPTSREELESDDRPSNDIVFKKVHSTYSKTIDMVMTPKFIQKTTQTMTWGKFGTAFDGTHGPGANQQERLEDLLYREEEASPPMEREEKDVWVKKSLTSVVNINCRDSAAGKEAEKASGISPSQAQPSKSTTEKLQASSKSPSRKRLEVSKTQLVPCKGAPDALPVVRNFECDDEFFLDSNLLNSPKGVGYVLPDSDIKFNSHQHDTISKYKI
jgi:hypothetical protein